MYSYKKYKNEWGQLMIGTENQNKGHTCLDFQQSTLHTK